MQEDLRRIFERLDHPRSGTGHESLSAVALPAFRGCRLGRDQEGMPAIMVSVQRDSSMPAPVRLENLAVDYGLECRIWKGGAVVEQGSFTVVRCIGDASLRDYFFDVVPSLLSAVGENPSAGHVASVVGGLVELFRSLATPPRKSVQGLWAELFVIAAARQVGLLMKAWHSAPDERYDFADGASRLEVKSAAGRQRRHHFSLEQLSVPDGARVIVASVCLERATGGTSLRALMTRIEARLPQNGELRLRLSRVVGMTLGKGLTAGLDEAFDEELASESLCYFDVAAIPRPEVGVPRLVTDVRFVSDLAELTPIDLKKEGLNAPLFKALPN